MEYNKLVVVSPLKAFRDASNRYVLTQKFLDGIELYKRLWGGQVRILCEPGETPSNNLDNIEVDENVFDLTCGSFTEKFFRSTLPRDGVVLCSVGEAFNQLSSICVSLDLPCIYVTEYTLRTRLQIIGQTTSNLIKRLWKVTRQIQQEIRQRKAIATSQGVQCNGSPTYRAYKSLSPSPLLFFDSRVERNMLLSEGDLKRRLDEYKAGRKLRLAFSGRLDLMKGVLDLPLIANHLRSANVSFEMSICGDGPLFLRLRDKIREMHLEEHVFLKGSLDFKSELVPFVSNFVDLFVCPHPQGDPSCTYLETMSCGVPVIGYDNEALATLIDESSGGWCTPIGRPKVLSSKIKSVGHNFADLEQVSHQALSFASRHTFEDTFASRISHIRHIVRNFDPHQRYLGP